MIDTKSSCRHRQVERPVAWRTTGRRISLANDDARSPLFVGYRYPGELISYAVWLYFRFPLSFRMVEEMLAARGIAVSYETTRKALCSTAGQRQCDPAMEPEIPPRTLQPHSTASPSLVRQVAPRWGRPHHRRQGRAPRVLITDKLKSYAAAKREIMPGVEHRQHKGLNDRWRIPTSRRDDESGL
jgi:putative transposase